MRKVYENRLRKLAKHLATGKLNSSKFHFGVYRTNLKDLEGNICGTVGCAIGELPALFPLQWKFSVTHGFNFPTLKTSKEINTEKDACDFFGINKEEYGALFLPGKNYINELKDLGREATKEDVSCNILTFIKLKQKEKRAAIKEK